MFKRFIMVIRSWFGAGIEKLEDPELLLQQAQEEMRTMHVKNRERVVESIGKKNGLQDLVQAMERQITRCQSRISEARDRKDENSAKELSDDLARLRKKKEALNRCLEQAIKTAEDVKRDIRCEDERIREKTREALRLKAEWLASQRNYGNGPSTLTETEAKTIVFALLVLIVALLTILCLVFRN